MNSLLKTHDSIGLVANSNGIDIANKNKIDNLIEALKDLGLNPILSPVFYKNKVHLMVVVRKEQIYLIHILKTQI